MGLKNEARAIREAYSSSINMKVQTSCPLCGKVLDIVKVKRPNYAVALNNEMYIDSEYQAYCEACWVTYSSKFIGALRPSNFGREVIK